MRTLGIEGLSVTMPHKSEVVEAVDELTPAATALGVCNCLFRPGDDDRIVGHSTDGDGFVAAFERRFGPVGGRSFLVAGAGGAARSIVEALGRVGATDIAITNRTVERAEPVAALASRARVVDGGLADAVGAADVVVNTTSVGMSGGPDPDGVPVPVAHLRPEQCVVDIVYQPRRTPLLLAAEKIGATVDDGVPMLVGQAALAFERWTGVDAPVEVMARAVLPTHR